MLFLMLFGCSQENQGFFLDLWDCGWMQRSFFGLVGVFLVGLGLGVSSGFSFGDSVVLEWWLGP